MISFKQLTSFHQDTAYVTSTGLCDRRIGLVPMNNPYVAVKWLYIFRKILHMVRDTMDLMNEFYNSQIPLTLLHPSKS